MDLFENIFTGDSGAEDGAWERTRGRDATAATVADAANDGFDDGVDDQDYDVVGGIGDEAYIADGMLGPDGKPLYEKGVAQVDDIGNVRTHIIHSFLVIRYL
jgi:hypothetical protein